MTGPRLPLLVLVPPLPCRTVGSASMEELVAEVRAFRARGHDVRLRLCRGRTARAEAEAAAALGVRVLVVTLPEHAVQEQLGLSCPRRALAMALRAAGVELAMGTLRDAANLAGPSARVADDGIDLPPAAAPVPCEPLHAIALALLASQHVDPCAEVFAGNALGARNADLLENILP